MRPFLRDLALFLMLQSALFAFFLRSVSRRSDEYLAAAVDKERRLARAPGPRVVFVGGSNLAFSQDSAEIGRRLGRTPINMGLHAGLGMPFLLREASAGLREGDLVVLSLEYDHFLHPVFIDGTADLYHRLLVLNPSAVRYCSWHNWWVGLCDNANGLGYFRAAVKTWYTGPRRADFPYQRSTFSAEGDLTFERGQHPSCAGKIGVFAGARNPAMLAFGCDRVAGFVAECRSRGIDVVCVMPTVPAEGVKLATLQEIERELSKIAPVLVGAQEALLPAGCFYDTYYHLNSEGARLRTKLLVSKLEPGLKSVPTRAVQQVAARGQ